MHLYGNPIVEVDADCEQATGRWLLWMLATEEGSGRTIHSVADNFD